MTVYEFRIFKPTGQDHTHTLSDNWGRYDQQPMVNPEHLETENPHVYGCVEVLLVYASFLFFFEKMKTSVSCLLIFRLELLYMLKRKLRALILWTERIWKQWVTLIRKSVHYTYNFIPRHAIFLIHSVNNINDILVVRLPVSETTYQTRVTCLGSF